MTAQVAADLRAAAEVLRRDGWTQSDYHVEVTDGEVCHCALGSLLVTVVGDGSPHPDDLSGEQRIRRYDPAVMTLARHLGHRHGLDVVDWNDAPGRTADEVIAALEAAADAAEAQP